MLGHHPARYQLAGQQEAPSQRISLWSTSWGTWTWAMAITAEEPIQRRRRARAGQDVRRQ
jgi:hypothetical protein